MPAATGGTTLPLVTHGRPTSSRGGSGPAEPPHDRGSQHPFDTPFSIMQTMQADLIRLREDLRTEQFDRKAEVTGLKNELAELRGIMTRDEMKQQADYDSLQLALKDLRTKEEADWTNTRADMEAGFAKRTLVSDHGILSSRVDGCIQNVADSNDNFHKILSDLHRDIKANSDGDNDFAQHMKTEIASQREELDKNKANDQNFEDTVLVQLRMAGHLLTGAGTSDRRATAGGLPRMTGKAQVLSLPGQGRAGGQ
mmetsp:Transcript_142100/g.454234  ORF Transcript_142100/g.454234 Transcript_142100/m.454234 type:complete len:254 (-) Transcript_142100:53-814(-)